MLKNDVMDMMVVKVDANKSAEWPVILALEVGEVASSPSFAVMIMLLRINAMRLVRFANNAVRVAVWSSLVVMNCGKWDPVAVACNAVGSGYKPLWMVI